MLCTTAALSSDKLEENSLFLHKLPDSEIARLFSEGKDDIPLEFNLEEEKTLDKESLHREKREEMEVRLPGIGDFSMPLSTITQNQQHRMRDGILRGARNVEHDLVIGTSGLGVRRAPIGSHFEEDPVEFMIPEGTNQSAVLLGTLTFVETKGEQPHFQISMDRLHWFSLGNISKTEKDGKTLYFIDVTLVPGAEIRKELTKDGLYKFIIDAQSDSMAAVCQVRVEVLALSPTTSRTITMESTTTASDSEESFMFGQQMNTSDVVEGFQNTKPDETTAFSTDSQESIKINKDSAETEFMETVDHTVEIANTTSAVLPTVEDMSEFEIRKEAAIEGTSIVQNRSSEAQIEKDDGIQQPEDVRKAMVFDNMVPTLLSSANSREKSIIGSTSLNPVRPSSKTIESGETSQTVKQASDFEFEQTLGNTFEALNTTPASLEELSDTNESSGDSEVEMMETAEPNDIFTIPPDFVIENINADAKSPVFSSKFASRNTMNSMAFDQDAEGSGFESDAFKSIDSVETDLLNKMTTIETDISPSAGVLETTTTFGDSSFKASIEEVRKISVVPNVVNPNAKDTSLEDSAKEGEQKESSSNHGTTTATLIQFRKKDRSSSELLATTFETFAEQLETTTMGLIEESTETSGEEVETSSDVDAESETDSTTEEEEKEIQSSGEQLGMENFDTSTRSQLPSENEDQRIDFSSVTNDEEIMNEKISLMNSQEVEESSPIILRVEKPQSTGINENREFTLLIEGTNNGAYLIPEDIRTGYVLRNLSFSIQSNEPSNSIVNLSLDHSDAVAIRPRVLPPGGKAFLIITDYNKVEPETLLTVSAERDGEVSNQRFLLLRTKTETSTTMPKKFSFSVSSDAVSGSTVGSVEHGGNMKPVGNWNKFSLDGDDVLVSCEKSSACLKDLFPKQSLFLVNEKDSSLVEIVVSISSVSELRATQSMDLSDHLIRISSNQLVMPFVLRVSEDQEVRVGGTAAEFLKLEQFDSNHYQAKLFNTASAGTHKLEIMSNGVKDEIETVDVIVTNSHTKAHFRISSYMKSITAIEVVQDALLGQAELEGVPIDEARIVVLSGNPGWITVEEYGGKIRVSQLNGETSSGTWEVLIGAVDKATNILLAEMKFVLTVTEGRMTQRKIFKQSFYQTTLDREESKELSVLVESVGVADVQIDRATVSAMGEDGAVITLPEHAVRFANSRVVLDKELVKNARVVQLQLKADDHNRATVVFHLKSSEDFLEKKRKEAQRPAFPFPSGKTFKLQISETTPVDSVVAVLPAVRPDGSRAEIRLSGPSKDLLRVDSDTGAFYLNEAIDADVLGENKNQVVVLSAGEEGFQAEMNLLVEAVDKDDNRPFIEKGSKLIEISESTPIGTEIARKAVSDKDEISLSRGLNLSLTGEGAQLFKVELEGSVAVVSVNATLDRETDAVLPFVITVTDSAAATDNTLMVVGLQDENDNRPKFRSATLVTQALDDWPIGSVVTRIIADDADEGMNSLLFYQLLPSGIKAFAVDSDTGDVSVSAELMGLAREEPYNIPILVQDGGNPPLNSTSILRIKISSPMSHETQITFEQPGKDTLLTISEDSPVNTKIFQAKTKITGSTNTQKRVKYSLKELSTDTGEIRECDTFGIDETSGEIFIKESLNYEHTSFYMLLISGRDLSISSVATRLLRISIQNVDDSLPTFPTGSQYLRIDGTTPSAVAVGRVTAMDLDADPLYYHLIKCNETSEISSMFSIDSEFGELTFLPKTKINKDLSTFVCVLASNLESVDNLSNISFSATNSSMTRVYIKIFGPETHPIQKLKDHLPKIVVLDDNLENTDLSMEGLSDSPITHSISNVSFQPVSSSSFPVLSPQKLFTAVPNGEIRVSPKVAENVEGVYTVNLLAKSGNETISTYSRQFHYVKKSSLLRYVFDNPLAEIGKHRRDIIMTLEEGLRADHPEEELSLVAREPERDPRNRARSMLCVHVVRGASQIVSPEDAMALHSQASLPQSRLSLAYSRLKIINVENCEQVPIAEASVIDSNKISLILIALAVLLLFIVLTLCVYFAVVVRYRKHMEHKKKLLHLSSIQRTHMDMTPTFVLPTVIAPMDYY